MSLEQDIESFKKLINGNNPNMNDSLTLLFARPYLFTNEYLYSYFSQINFENKRVLTTGSSGDQILVSMACGARKVTCFDVNPFAEYIYNLKVAFIKHFDYHQIHKIFVNNIHQELNLQNAYYYQMVKEYLPPKSREFWDAAFDSGLDMSCWINHSGNNSYERPVCEYLTNKDLFLAIKNALISNACNVDFINCEFKDLPNNLTNKKPYDIILLSNISDYIFAWAAGSMSKKQAMFTDSVNRLASNNLTKDGIIQLGYSWGGEPTQLDEMFPTVNKTRHEARKGEFAIFISPNIVKDDEFHPPFGGQ